MFRRQLFPRLLLAAAALTTLPTLLPAAPARPNILWMLAEDIGPEVFSYSGTPEAHTPVIDELARSGMLYTRAYTTAPVCSPSRTALITGLYATTLGGHNHRTKNKPALPEGVRILPDRLRDAGYFTANLVTLPPDTGFKGSGKTDWNFQYDGKAFDSKNWADLKDHQPFYAQINFSETHRDFKGPAGADPDKIVLPPYYPDHPIARKDWADYLDSARGLDAKVGKVLDLLKADGLAGNTIVVLMGDNGQAHIRGKQFLYEEGVHVPLMIRWPSDVEKPAGYLPGKVNNNLVLSLDLTASTLDWAGLPQPPGLHGRPLTGLSAGAPRDMVFAARDRMDETMMRHRAVRDNRYRYIRNFNPEIPFFSRNAYKAKQYPMWNLVQELHAAGKLTPAQAQLCAPRMPEEELYDLDSDPHEINNLATSQNPNHTLALTKLRKAVETWITETKDRGALPDPDAGLLKSK